ncbi:Dihydropteroate synthase [Sedimentisphaera cyanobacteriorum]|uniref:Dihydropteroate synthase n=1 Tax=Sedimentisphaera cyanobacteriorum TaxID=1940790 RepID=A0A1Q2HN15_9BACT|nr:dihydropteroate synthase [Sedimentisphaera cyanobacteriorum]AQQ08828.1 Dihydropteroate synthase [Sedimentisphaera cyanobacteriorum]
MKLNIKNELKGRELPLVMGILNVTPDSFSDGGDYSDLKSAVMRADELICEGAEIIDVGAESTRPGAEPVSPEIQIERFYEVIKAVKAKHSTRISIDTQSSTAAEAALEAGADIINDISSGSDPKMFKLAAEKSAGIVLMHMQGTPRTMQKTPEYENVTFDVMEYLKKRKSSAVEAGVCEDNIILDPGIGFGKTLKHNLELTRNLRKIKDLGSPVLYGASRKSFIGKITGRQEAKNREGGTIASTIYAMQQGVSLIRVHRPGINLDAMRLYRTLEEGINPA